MAHPSSDAEADALYYIPQILNTQREAIKALKEIRSLTKKAYKSNNLALHEALYEATHPLLALIEHECCGAIESLCAELDANKNCTLESLSDCTASMKDSHELKEEALRIQDEIAKETSDLTYHNEVDANY